MESRRIKTDCGVIGGGLAGISAAIELADAGKKVDLFVKGTLFESCNSYLLAGGLAAVSPQGDDSIKIHMQDTLNAGKGLNDEKIVQFSLEQFYPEVIQWLVSKGVHFDKTLHKEGGHSRSRIFHMEDTTGVSIMKTLSKIIKEHSNINLHENHVVIDLITRNWIKKTRKGKNSCYGFYVYDVENDQVKTVLCKSTFLATGGLGKVFLYTSNSEKSSGDGFAIGYRVGLPLVNMEFVQFHPTVFYDPSSVRDTEKRFLLTEALRGAGAILKLSKDSTKDFVLDYDPQGSRATRDVVSRAEDIEMRKNGLTHVWLDCTKIDEKQLKEDFRKTYDFCLSKGIDIAKEPVPTVYAVHYSNGGVLTGFNGETEMNNLYVIGETAYTGLHGATRLASNSGPEAVLFGRLSAKDFLSHQKLVKDKIEIPSWRAGKVKKLRDKTTVDYFWETIRRTMTALCGISRNRERLLAAKNILKSLKADLDEYYWKYQITSDFLEVRNLVDVALIIVESALKREESRACHFREDFPKQDDKHFLKPTILRKRWNSEF